MKKIISYSLWGDDPKYCIGAIKNIESKNKYYPDWICRFYCDKKVPIEIINKLTQLGSEVIIIDIIGNWKFNLERFKAIDDNDVDFVIFRDTDSRLNERESKAVKEWMKSNKAIHIMRDHPMHGIFPILAGMWGINKNKFHFNMEKMIMLYKNLNLEDQYFYDQIFLANYIWRNFNEDCCIHDEFFSNKNFPIERKNYEFVGQSFDENDNTPEEHILILKQHYGN